MSEPKFTPGPWVNNQGRIESDLEHGWVNDGWCLAECHGPQAEINAHLIAAAPELYEALDDLMDWDSSLSVCERAKRVKAAKAALAKARGEG